MIEIWKQIKGYEGIYSISDLGRVKSHARVVHRDGPAGPMRLRDRILKATPGDRGYLLVGLYRNEEMTLWRVHLLVAHAFLEPRPEGHECAHGDGNPSNCRRDNLRWATHTENMRDAVRHGRSLRGAKNPNVRLDEARVLEIFNDVRSQRDIAAARCVPASTVSSIKRGNSWGWLTSGEST